MFVNNFITMFNVISTESFGYVVILAVLIISAVLYPIRLYVNKRKRKSFVCTEGEITYVEKYSYHSGGRRYIDPPVGVPTDNGYRVKYAFKVGYTYYDNDYRQHNGEFRVESGFSGMLAGRKLKVYFDPNNPSHSIAENDIKEQEKAAVGLYVFLVIIVLMVVPAILMLIKVS